MAKLPDMSKFSAKDLKALDELLAKAGTSIAALSRGGGKTPSPMSNPEYVAKCIAFRPKLEEMCAQEGVTLGHVFTASDKPRKVYKNPTTGAEWKSAGKKPDWLKGHEATYLVLA